MDEKFGLVALSVPWLEARLPMRLGCGIHLHAEFRIEIENEFWRKGLGEWRIEDLHECNLFIVSKANSEQADILDEESRQLLNDSWLFAYALSLAGAKFGRTPISIEGNRIDGEENVRRFGPGQQLLQTKDHPYTIVNDNRILEAEAAFGGLKRVFANGAQFKRFRKGARSLFEGMTNQSCDDRAYFFVRAIEALHATSKGDGAGQFVYKCLKFTDPNSSNERLFADLYSIRNNVVHANGFDSMVKAGENPQAAEARVVFQCLEAELIAKELYRRILSDTTLLDHFEDDAKIRQWWDSNGHFGSPIDLAVLRATRKKEVEESRD